MPTPVVALERRAATAAGADAEATALLDRALLHIDFAGLVRGRIAHAAERNAACTAVIVPALDAYAANSPAATDPALVEHLLDALFDLGVTRAIIGSTRDSAALWLENRDVFVVADLLGYHYTTPAGRPYDVIDLSEEVTDDAFPASCALANTALSCAWLEADLRIVFASNRTDEAHGYALCLATLLSILPLTDKQYHYHDRRDAGAVVTALLGAAQVDVALIDAVVSAHGNGGGRAPCPIRTDTIIAATDPALADHFGALLMGLDPFVSTLAAPALRRPGLLANVRVLGELDAYPGWINATPMLRAAVASRRASVSLDRAVQPALQVVDRSLFAFKDAAYDQINQTLSGFFADDDAAAPGLLTWFNLWLGQIARALQASRTLFDKDALRHREAPINVDAAAFAPHAFTCISDAIAPLTDLLRGIAPGEDGLRWRMHDGAILFDGARRFPIRFDDFVAAVDIHRSIQYMNDYIGGSTHVVKRDARSRVVRQIERNLYLPQPNYTVLAGGEVIDVTKLETIRYSPHRHRMVWQTIRSENGSALADDGIVTFEALGSDTLVTIFGRQAFRLPPLLEALDLDKLPALKHALVSHAYGIFLRRTFANFEAVAEGREVRIGIPWTDHSAGEALPIARLTHAIATIRDSTAIDGIAIDPAAWLRARLAAPSPAGPSPVEIDADGFHHFEAAAAPPSPSGPGLLSGILADLRRSTETDLRILSETA